MTERPEPVLPAILVTEEGDWTVARSERPIVKGLFSRFFMEIAYSPSEGWRCSLVPVDGSRVEDFRPTDNMGALAAESLPMGPDGSYTVSEGFEPPNSLQVHVNREALRGLQDARMYLMHRLREELYAADERMWPEDEEELV